MEKKAAIRSAGPRRARPVRGTDRPALDVQLLSRNMDGITTQVDYLHARQGFRTDGELARALRVDKSRISAWKRGQTPDPENARALRDLAVVVRRLGEATDPDAIPSWLHGLNPRLDDRRPIDLILDRPPELPEVLAVIDAEEAAEFYGAW